jgi:hypothetical protein
MIAEFRFNVYDPWVARVVVYLQEMLDVMLYYWLTGIVLSWFQQNIDNRYSFSRRGSDYSRLDSIVTTKQSVCNVMKLYAGLII